MYQLLLIPIALGLAKLFTNLFKSNPELKRIKKDSIYKDYLITHNKNDSLKVTKQKITKSINQTIKNYDHFKIGKSGIPQSRASQYKEYKKNVSAL